MGKVAILDTTTRNPISLIGERAGICWGADTSSQVKNYQRGWDCITSGHGRALEYVVVDMIIEGYSARVIREYTRHIGGAPTYLQASTRYINYGGFDYIEPKSIADDDEARDIYRSEMLNISLSLERLEQIGIPREDCANLLPLGMATKIIDHRNVRNLIDMSHVRKCSRAMWEIRELFGAIENALIEYGSDSGEWETIVRTQFKPKCEVTGWCNEKNSCGRKPKKGDNK